MLYRLASQYLSQSQKRKLRSFNHKLKLGYIQTFRSYDFDQLLEAFTSLGLRRSDAVMVHSAYSPYNGFRGSPDQIIAALRETIGPGGTLLMPSSTYNGSTEDFVKKAEIFNVNRSFSCMGIVSEIFRQQDGTIRSHNPAHPILASGTHASWFTEGHDVCAHSCGEGSPFEKLVETDAKALFFDVQLRYMMFFHYLEHMLKDELPFDLYDPNIYQVPIIDVRGRKRNVSVYVFSREARKRRRFPMFVEQLRQEGKVRECKLGNTKLALVNLRDTVEAARKMARDNSYFYDLSDYS